MELYAVGFLKGVAVVAVRRKLGWDKVAGSILSGRYF